VNLEVDVIAKYIERILLYKGISETGETITREKLNKLGFV
jgi:riboflavin synthase alpha subunit